MPGLTSATKTSFKKFKKVPKAFGTQKTVKKGIKWPEKGLFCAKGKVEDVEQTVEEDVEQAPEKDVEQTAEEDVEQAAEEDVEQAAEENVEQAAGDDEKQAEFASERKRFS